MSKGFKQEKDIEITELAEEVLTFDDLEIDNDIQKWLQTPPVHLKEYGFGEADGEEEYYALVNELSELLLER